MVDKDISVAPISYCEEAAWQEFLTDKFVFFNRLFELKIPLPPSAGLDDARDLVAKITAKHEILRTGFQPSPDGVVRRVLPSYEHEVLVADEPDFSVNPDPDQTELTPTDLVTVWLVPGPDGGKLLLVDLNEMISDAWSSARLNTEILDMLGPDTAPSNGGPAAVPSYTEFAREQREHVLPAELTGYWLTRLRAAAHPSYILPDGPDPSGDPAGERIIVFTDDASDNLHKLCLKYRMSPFIGAVALVNMVMAARSGERDIMLGTIASIRTRKWTDVHGNFSNLLLLRTMLPAEPTFEDIMALTRETVLGGLAHKGVPYVRLPTPAGVERPLPPVRVHYLMNRDHNYDVLDGKASGEVWNEYATFATWPIELGFGEDVRRRVAIWASYDPRLYTHATVATLLDQCNEALRMCGAEPQLTCGEVRERLGLGS
jgi:hypothetical protein